MDIIIFINFQGMGKENVTRTTVPIILSHFEGEKEKDFKCTTNFCN